MSTIAQVTALRAGRKTDFETVISDIFQRGICRHPELVAGLSRTHQPFAEDPDGRQADQLPPEYKKVQTTVAAQMQRLQGPLVNYLNTELAIDRANAQAAADIVVQGTVLASQVPVSNLLWLEKRMAELVSLAQRLPELDPSQEWSWDPNRGCYVSAPVLTRSTKRTMRYQVTIAPTEHQPGQAVNWPEDVPNGTWTRVSLSGALGADEKHGLIGRLRELQDAIKLARAEANRTRVEDQDAGKRLNDWIFGGMLPQES